MMLRKPPQSKIKIQSKIQQSYAFTIENTRRKLLKHVAEEHMILIAVLFGGMIEEGKKTARDYERLTSTHINTDLQIRTLLNTSRRVNTEKHRKEVQEREERMALEEIRLFQSG